MKTVTKVIIGVLAAVAVLLAVAGIYIATMLGKVKRVSVEEAAEIAKQEQEQRESSETPDIDWPEETPEQDIQDEFTLVEQVEQTQLTEEELAAIAEEKKREGAVNILLLGVDRRGDSGYSRADTMLVATVDKKNNRLKLTSLMRDMYLPIPGRGENRINSACSAGGPGLLMETINQNFSMDLSQYVLVDFNMFTKIVDKLGGVTIKLSAGEVQEANDCIAGLNLQQGRDRTNGLITSESGKIRLTGQQALGYSRIRKFGNGDYSRTSRQFKVLSAIYDKFMAVDAGKKLDVVNAILPYIETNLTDGEILDLMATVLSMNVSSSDLMHYRLPAEGAFEQETVRGMWVLLPDVPANTKLLHDFIYEATEIEPLIGSNTGSGTYHPKPYKDADGNVIDPNATPSPSPEGDLIPEEAPTGEDAPPDEETPPDEGAPPDEETPPDEEVPPEGNSNSGTVGTPQSDGQVQLFDPSEADAPVQVEP